MVIKHLYFHSSNIDQIKDLSSDPSFEPSFKYYESTDFRGLLRNEYGRIKSGSNYYHLIFGNPPQKDCPWCCGPCELINNSEIKWKSKTSHIQCVIKCMKCDARGPLLNVNADVFYDKDAYQHMERLIWQRFNTRRPWDCGFKNPYEENNEVH